MVKYKYGEMVMVIETMMVCHGELSLFVYIFVCVCESRVLHVPIAMLLLLGRSTVSAALLGTVVTIVSLPIEERPSGIRDIRDKPGLHVGC